MKEEKAQKEVTQEKSPTEKKESTSSSKVVSLDEYSVEVKLIKHSVAKKLMKSSRESVNITRTLQKNQIKLVRAVDNLRDVPADSKEEVDLEARIDKLQNSIYELSDEVSDKKIEYVRIALPDLSAEEIDDYPEILIDQIIEAINDRAGLRIGSAKND